jgi:hypothetical protein
MGVRTDGAVADGLDEAGHVEAPTRRGVAGQGGAGRDDAAVDRVAVAGRRRDGGGGGHRQALEGRRERGNMERWVNWDGVTEWGEE